MITGEKREKQVFVYPNQKTKHDMSHHVMWDFVDTQVYKVIRVRQKDRKTYQWQGLFSQRLMRVVVDVVSSGLYNIYCTSRHLIDCRKTHNPFYKAYLVLSLVPLYLNFQILCGFFAWCVMKVFRDCYFLDNNPTTRGFLLFLSFSVCRKEKIIKIMLSLKECETNSSNRCHVYYEQYQNIKNKI